MAPESKYPKESSRATARATLDFPAPAGPSIAITIPQPRLTSMHPRAKTRLERYASQKRVFCQSSFCAPRDRG
jgi:hypothetical protein